MWNVEAAIIYFSFVGCGRAVLQTSPSCWHASPSSGALAVMQLQHFSTGCPRSE